jgi:hypothetical protein
MTRRSSLVAWAAAAVVIVALTTSCTADDQASKADPAQNATSSARPKQVDLQTVLLAAKDHPQGSQVMPTVPLRQAVARALPGTGEPSGIVVLPRCISYFSAFGGLDVLEGWHQWGIRSNGAIFVHFVAKAPADAVDLVRMRVGACGEGLQSIQGWPPSATKGGRVIPSVLKFTERDVPDVPGASTYGVTQTTTFQKLNDPLVQTIRTAWRCTDRPCAAYDSFIQRGEYLIWVHEGGDEALADRMAKVLYDRLGL